MAHARQVKANAESRYRGQERDEKIRVKGIPTIVPTVPGAKGAKPLPKPVAVTLMNLSFRRHLFFAD